MVVKLLVGAVVGLAACGAAWADEPVTAAPPGLGDAVVVPAETAADPAATLPEPALESVLVAEEAAPADVTAPADVAVPAPAAGYGLVADPTGAYTQVDSLFLSRTNTVGPLAVVSAGAADAGATVIGAGDVRYPTFPGLRVLQGWRRADCTGLEVGYLGVWGMYADALAVSPTEDLSLPGQLGAIENSGLGSARAIEPTLDATLNSAEVNVFGTHVLDGCRRHDPLPWRRAWDLFEGSTATVDWLFGVRWAGLDESAALAVTALADNTPPTFNTTVYRVTTSSQLIGPQIGHRRRVDWDVWSLEGWAKVGLMASSVTASQSAVVAPFDLDTIREPRSNTRVGVGMIGDLNASVVRRLGDTWGLRAGYTLLWLSGVAPAAAQWDFTNATTSGTRIVPGTVFLHGASLGLEAAW